MIKKIIFVNILFISFIVYSNSLSIEYYNLKNKLQFEYGPEGYPIVGIQAISNRKYDDYQTLLKVISYLTNESFNNDVLIERRWVGTAGNFIANVASKEDLNKFINLFKKWQNDDYIYDFTKKGLSKENAIETLEARDNIRNPKKFDIGNNQFLTLFNRNQFENEIIIQYIISLIDIRSNKAIANFYENYFDKIPVKYFSHHLSYLLFQGFNKAFGNTDKMREACNKFIDKINSDPLPFNQNKYSNDWTKDEYANLLLRKDIISDQQIKIKVLEFLKRNDFLLKNREEKYSLKPESIEFITNNWKELNLTKENVDRIRNGLKK